MFKEIAEMQDSRIDEQGARAFYFAEQGHRIIEFEKEADSCARIEADFRMCRTRYVQKFRDLAESLKARGLTIRQTLSG